MPTGYTAPVRDGEITELRDFVLNCAHAFVVSLRGSLPGSEIPLIEPNTEYNERSLAEAKERLAELAAMDDDEKTQAAAAAWEQHVAQIEESNRRDAEYRRRYKAMLEKVRAWEPPSEQHINMKQFMIEQLEESIRFDCHDDRRIVGEPYDPEAWWLEQIEIEQRSMAHHIKRRNEEIERVRQRNEWVRLLYESLA